MKKDRMENLQSTKKTDGNTAEIEQKIINLYRDVALHPDGEYYFDRGRPLAERLGYDDASLNAAPAGAVESFTGAGYFFDLADIRPGETVLDLGCGSGMDTFIAALKAGKKGRVIGMDITKELIEKAEGLKRSYEEEDLRYERSYEEEDIRYERSYEVEDIRYERSYEEEDIRYERGNITDLRFEDAMFDVVISNGVINLCADKKQVFSEAARVLKPNGRMAFADIVTERVLPENVVGNSTLWASCLGGACQIDAYQKIIEQSGLRIVHLRENRSYKFLLDPAKDAAEKYGVKSISILAEKKGAD